MTLLLDDITIGPFILTPASQSLLTLLPILKNEFGMCRPGIIPATSQTFFYYTTHVQVHVEGFATICFPVRL